MLETPARIEPTRLAETPEVTTDLLAELTEASTRLGNSLHPKTAKSLSDLIRIMNTYYSNLIEGHRTMPRDIERATAGQLDDDHSKRNLQLEALAHLRVQAEIDAMYAANKLPLPTTSEFIKWLHRAFYEDVPTEMLIIRGRKIEFEMTPGEWRSEPQHDVVVGQHVPPSSERVAAFMDYFEEHYALANARLATKILAIPAAHHRFNYIHPFPDGNGRVSRLMSHAMSLHAGIGAHGLWSISRGLARGLKSRREYKMKMSLADSPRRSDIDGRGNLSQAALIEFTNWFLEVCLDQVTFMADLFDINSLSGRLERYVDRRDNLKPQATRLLQEALSRGEFERGDAGRITGLPERTARRVLNDVIDDGVLASETPKGPVSLRFPIDALETLFPKLYPEA